MSIIPTELEDVLECVNRYIAEGTTEDAIARLKELQDEMAVTMEALMSDQQRNARAAEREISEGGPDAE